MTRTKIIRRDEKEYFILLQDSGKWHLINEKYDASKISRYKPYETNNPYIGCENKNGGTLSIIVFMTEKCNLRCDYCKVARMVTSPRKKKTDAKKITKRLIESLNWAEGEINIIFYGGEPLLQYKEINDICNDLEHHNKWRFIYSVTTNGTLFNDDILQVLVRHNIKVGVSMDGKHESHDDHRVYIARNGSHHLVSKNYSIMKKSGLQCGPICVITNPSSYIETFDYFVEQFNDTYIYLKPLEVTGLEDCRELSRYFQSLLEQQLELLRRNITDFAAGKVGLVETHTMTKLENILLSHDPGIKTCKNDHMSHCSINKNIRGIESDGVVTPCPTMKKHDEWDQAFVELVAKKNGYCEDCNYSSVCTSFCLGEMDSNYIRSFVENNNTEHVDIICRYNKLFIDAVFDMLRENKKHLVDYVFQLDHGSLRQ
ncbi:4Fe-4S cluster-binding domain-containing protein [Pseudomonas sp. 32.2.56]|uniref:radical SAM protein n=1 Tax=Pseudomonas sp. 32.2.56 TaxID=2969303 RepID=UPI00214FCD63|nr:radical SAM protein [Pseudomonas sp. 32.2.56]MCR4507761.1 4Fe-4S cluster-binding domain-containing protein [Pseudomonas sp. 32.2.56]